MHNWKSERFSLKIHKQLFCTVLHFNSNHIEVSIVMQIIHKPFIIYEFKSNVLLMKVFIQYSDNILSLIQKHWLISCLSCKMSNVLSSFCEKISLKWENIRVHLKVQIKLSLQKIDAKMSSFNKIYNRIISFFRLRIKLNVLQ